MSDWIQDRDAAWQALHDPGTPPDALAEIAAAHPEFATKIASHPQCYDELRSWTEDQTTPVPAASGLPRRRGWIIAAAAGGVIVLAGSAWAVAASLDAKPELPAESGGGEQIAAGATPTPTPTYGERRLAGPPVYIGDELSWLLLDQKQLAKFVPDVAAPVWGDELYTVGESEGAHTDIDACLDWLFRDIRAVVGIRTLSWESPSLGELSGGTMAALQFPDADLAAEYYGARADTLGECASYQVLGPDETAYETISTDVLLRRDDGFVTSQSTDLQLLDTTHSVYLGVIEGNVVVELSADLAENATVDGVGMLDAVTVQAAAARERLTEEIGFRP